MIQIPFDLKFGDCSLYSNLIEHYFPFIFQNFVEISKTYIKKIEKKIKETQLVPLHLHIVVKKCNRLFLFCECTLILAVIQHTDS